MRLSRSCFISGESETSETQTVKQEKRPHSQVVYRQNSHKVQLSIFSIPATKNQTKTNKKYQPPQMEQQDMFFLLVEE